MSKGSTAKYYQNNEERLQKKKACERYHSLSTEEKEKKWQYGCERYKNLPGSSYQQVLTTSSKN